MIFTREAARGIENPHSRRIADGVHVMVVSTMAGGNLLKGVPWVLGVIQVKVRLL